MRSLLISDLDGCLLCDNDYDELKARLIILSNKYDIIIATGRRMTKLNLLINDQSLMNYVTGFVFLNGASIITDGIIKHFYFQKDEVQRITAFFNNIYLFNECDTRISMNGKYYYFDSIDKLDQIILKSPYFEAIIIAIPKSSINLLNWCINYLQSQNLNYYVDMINNDEFYYLEIKSSNVNKFSSARYIVNRKNIDYKQCVCFGDDLNDIHLFYTDDSCVRLTTDNHPIFLNNLITVRDLYIALDMQMEDLSSPYTQNRITLIEGQMIRKDFKKKDKYITEKEIYKSLSVDCIPKTFHFDDKSLSIYMEKCDFVKEVNDKDLIHLVEKFHLSTYSEHLVQEWNSNNSYSNWHLYLHEQTEKWIPRIEAYFSKCKELINSLLRVIPNKKRKVCLLHRDIRLANIGKIEGKLVLFDFELAMWGDPLWDYARICFERGKNFVNELENSLNFEFKEVEASILLYVFSYLNFLIKYQNNDNNNEEIRKCLIKVEEEKSKWI